MISRVFIFAAVALISFCDLPEHVNCFYLEQPTNDWGSGNEAGPVGECPPLNGEYVDFLPDSADCTVYYMCNWGVPIKMDCPAGLHWNVEINVCDWPEAAGCLTEQA